MEDIKKIWWHYFKLYQKRELKKYFNQWYKYAEC